MAPIPVDDFHASEDDPPIDIEETQRIAAELRAKILADPVARAAYDRKTAEIDSHYP